MRNDDKGFTIIEIVVVIAILGLLATMLIGSTSYIANSAARGLANSVKTAIGETRIKTMGKQETALYIYRSTEDDKFYKQFVVKVNGDWQKPETEEAIGKRNPVLTYEIKGDTNIYELTPGTGIFICFDRATGKERVIDPSIPPNDYIDVKVEASGRIAAPDTPGATPQKSIMCKKITVTGGGSVYDIKIEPATGKVTLE